MARGRMIDNCISISEKINDLPLKEAFFYTWIIPHLDDWGRITGSPRKLKALVFPMKKEISVPFIEKTLAKFKKIGLFLWEEINEHQSISENKRAKSKYPEILEVSQEMPENPKKPQEIPVQDKISKDKISKDKIYSSDLKDKSEQKSKINFNFSDKEWKNITEEDKKIWGDAYPACDIEQELKKMKAWILSAGAKGHKKNWLKFINNWLSNTQDRGGTKTNKKNSDWKDF